MPTTDQVQAALMRANDRRTRIAQLKTRIRRGEISLAEIMNDPPGELENWTCADVVALQYSRRTGTPALERLGRMAVRDDINLFVPMCRASVRTRAWITQHASWHVRPHSDSSRNRNRIYIKVDDHDPQRIPVAPLQQAVLDSGLSLSEICRRIGWTKRNGNRTSGDTSRLQRALGLRRESHSYARAPNERISLRNALRIAEAIGIDPCTVETWAGIDAPEPEPPAARINGACPECGAHDTWTDSLGQHRCEQCWAITPATLAANNDVVA